MGISKLNGAGYRDMTAHDALVAVEREEKNKSYRPLVFICSPFAGNVEQNIENARRYSKYAVEQGAIPIAPHLLFPQFMDDADQTQRELGMFFGLVLMSKCVEMWVFAERLSGEFTVSHDMKLEISKARKRGLPIWYFTEQCQEVK